MTRIVIAGAGSIGLFVGGLLQHAGHSVAFLGRARLLDRLRDQDLRLTDFTGLDLHVTPETLTEDPSILAEGDLILVTVKSSATDQMARLIATHAPAAAPVLSLQNGIDNAPKLQTVLPDRDVRAAMVPFNVVPGPDGHYHRATSGEIVIARGPGDWGQRLSSQALPFTETDRIIDLQWGKLLLNLTNALNALSGLTLLDMLRDRNWRRLMADQMSEAVSVLNAAQIPVASSTPIPLRWAPTILRLPTPIYTRLAARMLTIDRQARTSMAYDLRAGRLTEIDQLQGAILALAAQHHIKTPIVAAVCRAIKSIEGQGPVTPQMTPDQIRQA